jgi:hypothetical protein
MHQFDVYENPIPKGKKTFPFVCCIQNDLLHSLSTKVVAFITHSEAYALDKVSVPIMVKGKKYFLCMNVVATIEHKRLDNFVSNISDVRENIVNAYDTILLGI